eukprot:2617472-Alexandrium_andersonii.AAC.1
MALHPRFKELLALSEAGMLVYVLGHARVYASHNPCLVPPHPASWKPHCNTHTVQNAHGFE